MTEDSSPPLTLREEAAAWFAKMRGDDAARHRAAFEQWLARGAMHRAAYNRVGEIFAAGKLLKPDPASPRPMVERSSRWWAAAGIVSVATGLGIFHATGPDRSGGHAPSAARSVAPASRTLALADGATALLDVDGVVAPRTGGRDVVRLLRGRARLSVVADGAEHRLWAGATEIRSRGGTFDLWLRPGGSLDTRVLSGDVRLLPATLAGPGRPGASAIALFAGDYCRVEPNGRSSRSRGLYGTDWPQGILEFQQATLGDVLEEANRYSATKIVLADPALATRRITGRFTVADPHQLARRLAAALSLEVDASRREQVLLRVPN